MSIEEKITLDTSDLDKAIKKTRELRRQVEDGQEQQTRATKKGISNRRQAIRDSLAREILNIRAITANRISAINQAHKKEIITETQHAARLAAIRKNAQEQITEKRSKYGFDTPSSARIGVGAGITTGAVFAGALKIGKKTLETYRELELAIKGLEGTARAFNQDAGEATKLTKELAADGLVTIEQASQTMKFLISSGFSVSDSFELAKGIKDTAAFNNVIGDMGQAMVDSAKGIKTGSIELIENAGLTVRLGSEMQKLGFSTADLTNKTKKQAAAEALKGIIIKDTSKFAGDSARVLKTYSGAKTQAASASRELMGAIGQSLSTAITPFFRVLARGTRWVLEFWKALSPSSKQVLVWTTVLIGAISAIASFVKIVGLASSVIKAFGVSSLFSLGPLGLIIAGLAGVAAGIVAIVEATKESPGTEILKEVKRLEELEKQIGLTTKEQKKLNDLKKEINESYGPYLENLDAENRSLREQASIIDEIERLRNTEQGRAFAQVSTSSMETYSVQLERLTGNLSNLISRQEQGERGLEERIAQLQARIQYLAENFAARQESSGRTNRPARATSRRRGSGGGDSGRRLAELEAKKDEFTTTEGALERERAYVEARLQIVGDGLEKEALKKRQSKLEEELAHFDHNSKLTQTEREEAAARFELERLKIMGVRGAEIKAAREKANKLKKELKYEQSIQQERVRAAKEAEEKKLRFSQRAGEEMLKLGSALLSTEKGAFYAYLADRLRALSQAVAKEMFVRAAAAAASLNFVGAALYGAAGAAALTTGEVAARELDTEANRRRDAGRKKIESVNLGEIANFESPKVENPKVTYIQNNYNNETKVEITETGTYVGEAQFVRNRLKPLLSELAIEQGAVLYK